MKIKQIDNLNTLLEEIHKIKEPYMFLAGGTNIMMDSKRNALGVEIVYDLNNFKEELNFIHETNDSIEIGALTTVSELISDINIRNFVPQLAKALNSIGSLQIRNMATLAGNIGNASSVGDSLPVLLTKEAKIKTISNHGERVLSINEFFVGYKKTALKKGEIIKSILIEKNKEDGKYEFHKVAIRPEANVSKVNVSLSLEGNESKIATGGVHPYTIRLKSLEENILEKKHSISEIIALIKHDAKPIDDFRSTAEYRLKVLAELVSAFFY